MKAQAYNVEALEKLLSICKTSGASYKPGNASIEPTALTALLEEARKSIAAVDKARDDLRIAMDKRKEAFDLVPKIGAKIVAFAETSDFNHLEGLKVHNRKLRPQPFNRTVLKSGSGGQAEQSQSEISSDETPARKNRQLSFSARLETFSSLVSFLENESSYAPKEAEFTVAGLKNKIEALHALTVAVTDAKTALTNARKKQAELAFDDNGIFGVGTKVKRYCFAVFGRTSGVGKDISKVKLRSKA